MNFKLQEKNLGTMKIS